MPRLVYFRHSLWNERSTLNHYAQPCGEHPALFFQIVEDIRNISFSRGILLRKQFLNNSLDLLSIGKTDSQVFPF